MGAPLGPDSAGFKDPFIQRALWPVFGWPEIPMMAGVALLGAMHTDNAGFPVGASLEFARAIEQRYLALGGQIHYPRPGGAYPGRGRPRRGSQTL